MSRATDIPEWAHDWDGERRELLPHLNAIERDGELADCLFTSKQEAFSAGVALGQLGSATNDTARRCPETVQTEENASHDETHRRRNVTDTPERIYTRGDVVLEEFAVPPGASARDLRAGAWVDHRGFVTVRNIASGDDVCEQCGNAVVDELKSEFCKYPPGTCGAHDYPHGATRVSCFDEWHCAQRQVARDVWSNRFPAHVCNPYHPFPDYSRWNSFKVSRSRSHA